MCESVRKMGKFTGTQERGYHAKKLVKVSSIHIFVRFAYKEAMFFLCSIFKIKYILCRYI